MSLLTETAALLDRAKYTVTFSREERPTLIFEDEQVMGFAIEFSSQQQMVDNWQSQQDGFLQRNAFTLRRAGHKSWNIYFILLCASSPSEEQSITSAIEEDFRGTRKIVALNPKGENDLIRALLPLLPIQNGVRTRNAGLRGLLFDRLDLPPEVTQAIKDGASAEDLVGMMIDEK